MLLVRLSTTNETALKRREEQCVLYQKRRFGIFVREAVRVISCLGVQCSRCQNGKVVGKELGNQKKKQKEEDLLTKTEINFIFQVVDKDVGSSS